MEANILKNSAICRGCNDEIISRHRHHFVKCSCGEISVDGGLSYLRRIGGNYTDTSVYDDGTHELRRNTLVWGSNYDKDMNRLPETVYRLIKDLDTDHIGTLVNDGWIPKESLYYQVMVDELEYRKELS